MSDYTDVSTRVFRVSVDLPADTGRGARESLFTTILDAAIEWETEHLDGWDVDVHSTVVSVDATGEDYARRDGLPVHRTEAGWPRCATCDGGGCLDCTDPAR